MSQYSVFPWLHEFLYKIPYPGVGWQTVITSLPSLSHYHWSLFFAICSALLQTLCFIITKIFAPTCAGYSSIPSLPSLKRSKSTSCNYYISLGEAVNYTQPINVNKYSSDDLNALNSKYCDGKLSEKDMHLFFKHCNTHHMDCRKIEQKFQESLFPIFTKILTFGFGVCAFYNKEWLYHTETLYLGWPNHGIACCIADIKLLYFAHTGWYIYKLFAQVYLDRHLKDFIASLIHHVTAILLMAGSYQYGMVRFGVCVLLLHDPADIVLQIGKLCRLCGQQMLTNIAFGLLVICWFLTRLVIFPYFVVFSGYAFAALENGTFEQDHKMPVTILCVFVTVLCVLHVHWFYLIIKAVVRALSGKKVADPRSDNEDSDNNNSEDNDSDNEVDSDASNQKTR